MSTAFEAFNGPIQIGFMWISIWIITIIWSIAWKGFALWISAKEEKKWWFIVMLVLNTVGILEIIYIFFFSETGKKILKDVKEKRKYKTTKHQKKEEGED